MVSVIRRFIEEISGRLGADDDLAGRVALAAHELLENAAKYGRQGEGVLQLHSVLVGQQRRIMLTVKNHASAEHIDRLHGTFSQMDGNPDPFAHYFNLMNSGDGGDFSGLGLARIPAEADMPLRLSLKGDEVSICATSNPFTPSEKVSR